MAEWLRSPPLNQQIDIEDLGSYYGADKLETQASNCRKNQYQLQLGIKCGPKMHIDHLEKGDEVDPTMARKVIVCNFNFNSESFRSLTRCRRKIRLMITVPNVAYKENCLVRAPL